MENNAFQARNKRKTEGLVGRGREQSEPFPLAKVVKSSEWQDAVQHHNSNGLCPDTIEKESKLIKEQRVDVEWTF